MWLTRLAITRPVTILMLVVALVILGLQSRSRLPVDLMPKMDFPMLTITTMYPGTGPEEVQTLLSKPIEDAVSSISGIKKLSSTSAEGISVVIMQFEIGTNLDVVSSDVRSKIDAIRVTLPQEAKAPTVAKLDMGAQPVLRMSVQSDKRSPEELRRFADDVLKDQLAQVPGVGNVTVDGGDVREIRVAVDSRRLAAYGVSISQVVSALQAENLNLPSGSVEEARTTSAVRVMGEFTSPDQIKAVRIPNATGNRNLTVADVADVQDTVAERTKITRVNNVSSVAITVQKQSDANTVKVVDDVRAKLESLSGQQFVEQSALQKTWGWVRQHILQQKIGPPPGTLPADYQFAVAMDQSTFIRETLTDVYKALGEGAFLAILIVFLFLHTIRGTFIVGLAIPTSMIATFLVMDMLGFTVNMMSMMALSLTVGILVDDSIVVLENIHRHIELGETVRQAAIKGRTEIGLAALTITMVDVVVFVPVAFMGGIVGQVFRQFGITVAAATLFSLFISFTLTPMLASRWLKSKAEEEAEENAITREGLFHKFVRGWEAVYGSIEALYRRVLAWSLDHRVVVICLGLMTLIGSFATAVTKTSLTALPGRLPLILVAAALIYGLWLLIGLTGGWVRGLLVVPGFFVSVLIAVIGSTIQLTGATGSAGVSPASHQPDPFILLLLIMAIFAFMALTLSGKARATVTAPVFAWSAILVCAVLFIPSRFSFEFMPKTDQRQCTVKIEQNVGASLDVTDKTTNRIETALLDPQQFPETDKIMTSVGSTSSTSLSVGTTSEDVAEVNVQLKDYVKGSRHTEDVVAAINKQFSELPGVKVTASETSSMGGGGTPIQIEITGDDPARINTVADAYLKTVKDMEGEGVYGGELSSTSGRPELQAHIDRDRAAQYGLSVSQIAGALRASLQGDTSSQYREGDREYDIRVQLQKDQRDVVADIPHLIVGQDAGGQPVYLYEVTTQSLTSGPTNVQRVDRRRAVTLTANLRGDARLGNIQQEITAKMAGLDTRGVTVNWAGSAQMQSEGFGDMLGALRLSVILVFMLMAALFESLLAPLIIMLAVPQAMAGAIFALDFAHLSISIMSLIGIIMLVGLVTKNSILMVDYTNTLRREHGLSIRDALLQAGPTRLRPILMTTLAMIGGMLPTALALTKGSEMRQPLAITVIGGLVLSLFLTLVMVPSFYEIMNIVGDWFSRLFHRGKAPAPPEPLEEETETESTDF